MSINKWMGKEDVVNIYNGILFSHEKELNNAVCSNKDGLRDYHTKWSKSERERQIAHDIYYMWILKYDTNEHIYEIKADRHKERHKEQTCGCQVGAERGKDWELMISSCTLFMQNG